MGVFWWNERLIEECIQTKSGLDQKDQLGSTALFYACSVIKKRELVKRIIEAGCNINLVSRYGESPLLYIFKNEDADSDIGKLLLDYGANPNTRGWNGVTALMYAAHHPSMALFNGLMEKKPDVNMKNNYGQTAIMDAIIARSLEKVKALVEAGADLEMKDYDGKTAIMYDSTLVGSKDDEIIQYLLSVGADINTLVGHDKAEFYFAMYPKILENIEQNKDILSPLNLKKWKSLRLKHMFRLS